MSWNPDDAVIAAVGRSPIGRARKGALKDIRPDDLAAQVVGAVMDRVPGLTEGTIEDLVFGCAQPEGEHGGNIARRVAVMLGRDDVPGTTVNRFCASSLQAARMAFHGIRAGEGDAYVIGGVESVSRYGQIDSAENPLFDDARAHAQRQARETGSWQDPRLGGSLPDVYLPMGLTAEFVARHTGTTRQDQDAYAARSQQRAARAQDEGFMAREIIPVRLPDGSVVDTDDSLRRGTTTATLAELSPAFLEDGTVTAGNACPLNDGASAAVILSGRRATELGITPLARIVSSAVTGLSPEIMGLGPVDASRAALRRAGIQVGDLDAVELNEAFATQSLACIRELGLDEDKVNTWGGAIALGHPLGSSGSRITITLLNRLEQEGGTRGIATLCVGVGQGSAIAIERV